MEKVKVIQERLCIAHSIQKCYADQIVRDVAYMVGEKVLLRMSPMKGMMQFEKRGKLSLRFIGLFEILEGVGEVAYRLALPPSPAGLEENLAYEEELVAILDLQ
uniref:Tf2-1-like SH3-like domain-containing protein n=1 Tax=Nicotiana tabacum TaxID=4097 RepID=A0A1S4DRD6_TOBAC